jgi:hypothetical protein
MKELLIDEFADFDPLEMVIGEENGDKKGKPHF